MTIIDGLIRSEADGSLSFGNYSLPKKSKVSDFEHNGDLYKVKTAPTLLFFKNGNYLDRHQGFIEAEEIASVFENNE